MTRASSKNHFVKKQDETVVEVDVPNKDLKVLVPDNRYAYGDNESVAHMAQDVVGKNANYTPEEKKMGYNSDTAAKNAYEQAREQLETTDFEALKRQQALERVYAKKPKFTLVPDEDDFGWVKGYTVYTRLTHPSGLQEMKEVYLTIDQLADFGG